MGAGFILRDRFDLLFFERDRFDHVDKPELAEVMVLRVALSTTLHQTHFEVMVVSDCANLID
jgi:hypothetical protein